VTRVNVASSVFLASIPSPDRGVWELGPIPLRAYALCIIAGIVVAIWWTERRWVARGGTAGTVIDIAVFAVPFGLVGGRLYHVATDYHRYFGEGRNPLDALRIWDGGLGIWGAIAFGAVGAWIGCRVKKVPLPALADAAAPGIVVAQGIGRVGNYFNQELYGGPTELPWALEIYRRMNGTVEDNLNGVAVNHIPVEVVHPTFLYELLWNLAVAALVVWADRRFRLGHGRAFAVYVAGYTLGRVWIELMRTDEATMVGGVRINVWVSIALFVGAIVYLVLAKRRGPREEPATLQGIVPPDGDKPAADADATGSDEDEDSDKEPEEAGDKAEAEDSEADEKTGEKADEKSGEKAEEKAGDVKAAKSEDTAAVSGKDLLDKEDDKEDGESEKEPSPASGKES
jgi:prolipoprotein diacylglyceryl transferase